MSNDNIGVVIAGGLTGTLVAGAVAQMAFTAFGAFLLEMMGWGSPFSMAQLLGISAITGAGTGLFLLACIFESGPNMGAGSGSMAALIPMYVIVALAASCIAIKAARILGLGGHGGSSFIFTASFLGMSALPVVAGACMLAFFAAAFLLSQAKSTLSHMRMPSFDLPPISCPHIAVPTLKLPTFCERRDPVNHSHYDDYGYETRRDIPEDRPFLNADDEPRSASGCAAFLQRFRSR